MTGAAGLPPSRLISFQRGGAAEQPAPAGRGSRRPAPGGSSTALGGGSPRTRTQHRSVAGGCGEGGGGLPRSLLFRSCGNRRKERGGNGRAWGGRNGGAAARQRRPMAAPCGTGSVRRVARGQGAPARPAPTGRGTCGLARGGRAGAARLPSQLPGGERGSQLTLAPSRPRRVLLSSRISRLSSCGRMRIFCFFRSFRKEQEVDGTSYQ